MKYSSIFIYPLLLILSLSLWAFYPAQITTKVEGAVYHMNGGLQSVQVSVLDKNNNFKGYYEPTDNSGTYVLRFNAVEGAPLNLKYTKENYSTLITDYTPHRKYISTPFQDIHLIKLSEKNNFSQSASTTSVNIYTDKDFSKYYSYDSNEFDYFTHIKKSSDKVIFSIAEKSDVSGYWYEVSFLLKKGDKIYKGWFFEKEQS